MCSSGSSQDSAGKQKLDDVGLFFFFLIPELASKSKRSSFS